MPDSAAWDPATLQFYAGNADQYAAARPDEPTRELLAFLPRLPPGSLILELGCGSGRDAAGMLALGYLVDATDGSPEMAALASQRLGRPVPVLRFDTLAAQAEYDAVVACASLLHVPRAGLPGVLARIWRALKPGAWHFASYKTAAPPGRDGHGRYYNRLEEAEACTLYRSAGDWSEIAFQHYDAAGYFGEPSRWFTVTARKSARPDMPSGLAAQYA